jgi:hypothetical protein
MMLAVLLRLAYLGVTNALAAALRLLPMSDRAKDAEILALPAPRSASLYPQRSWEELEGRFLGLMPYLESKDAREQ